MKKIFLFLLLSSFFHQNYAQVTKTTAELELEINKAVADSDYEKAAVLKRQKEILEQIDVAVQRVDYEAAAKLKKQFNSVTINQIEAIAKLETEKKVAVQNEDYSKAAEIKKQINALKIGEPIVVQATSNLKPEYSNTNSFIEKSDFFIDVSYGMNFINFDNVVGYYDYYFRMDKSYTLKRENTTMPVVSGRIGTRWNFGENEVFRMGFQVIWGRIAVGLSDNIDKEPVQQIAPLNVGVVGSYALSENMGIEASLNGGFEAYSSEFVIGYGYVINPQIKYRFRKLNVGLELLASNYTLQYQNYSGVKGSGFVIQPAIVLGLTF